MMLDDFGGCGLQLSCGWGFLNFLVFGLFGFVFFFLLLESNIWTTLTFPSTSSDLDRQGISLLRDSSSVNLVQYWTSLACETCSKLPASCWINFLLVQLLELNCCGSLMTPWIKGVWLVREVSHLKACPHLWLCESWIGMVYLHLCRCLASRHLPKPS